MERITRGYGGTAILQNDTCKIENFKVSEYTNKETNEHGITSENMKLTSYSTTKEKEQQSMKGKFFLMLISVFLIAKSRKVITASLKLQFSG
jgi:hypothetical protein